MITKIKCVSLKQFYKKMKKEDYGIYLVHLLYEYHNGEYVEYNALFNNLGDKSDWIWNWTGPDCCYILGYEDIKRIGVWGQNI